MDFKPRYLVEKRTESSQLLNSSDPLNSERSFGTKEIVQKEIYLAFCFNVKMSEQDFGEVASAIPNAILEDIIADVDLMQGQASCPGFDKMQVYKDVCVSAGGMAVGSNKTFTDDFGDNRNQI